MKTSDGNRPEDVPAEPAHGEQPETPRNVDDDPLAVDPPIEPATSDEPPGAAAGVTEPDLPVSGDTLIAWNFWADARFNSATDTIPYYEENLPRLRAAFERRFGQITTEYYCETFVGGYVLTDRGHLFTVNNETRGDAADLAEIIEQAGRLETEANYCLDAKDLAKLRKNCVELASYPVSTALGLLDDTKATADATARAQERSSKAAPYQLAQDQLAYARTYFERVAQRTAQLRYFRGIVNGVVTIVIVGVACALLLLLGTRLSHAHVSFKGLVPLLAGAIGGSIGALVSVMARMTSGHLKIDSTAGEVQLKRLGFFRPLIGSVFGAAVAALITGGVLPIAQPEDAAQAAYFFAAIGFLAGFSERWAQDMLSRSEGLLSPPTSKDPKPPDAS
jgi:hypothetical protein